MPTAAQIRILPACSLLSQFPASELITSANLVRCLSLLFCLLFLSLLFAAAGHISSAVSSFYLFLLFRAYVNEKTLRTHYGLRLPRTRRTVKHLSKRFFRFRCKWKRKKVFHKFKSKSTIVNFPASFEPFALHSFTLFQVISLAPEGI